MLKNIISRDINGAKSHVRVSFGLTFISIINKTIRIVIIRQACVEKGMGNPLPGVGTNFGSPLKVDSLYSNHMNI